MKNFMNNYKSIVIGDARTEARFVNEITKVPGVELESIRSNWEFIDERDSIMKNITHGKKELKIEFKWHDHKIMILSHYDDCISISADGKDLGVVYWSVEYGYLSSRYANPIEMKKWEVYLVDSILLKIVGRVGRRCEHIEYRTSCTYDGYEIIADRARIIAKNITAGEMHDIIGHTITGGIWWSNDYKYSDLIRFIKKNFIRK